VNINELKLDHDIKRPYRAPSIEELEQHAMKKGQASFADLHVSQQTYRGKMVFVYTVSGKRVPREFAQRAFV
jgi:hypothetical protein